MMGTEDAK